VRVSLLAACALLTWTSLAHAEGTSANDAAAAEKLFQDGRALMGSGKYPQACPMLAESQRLDPAVGTLLNLGECYEKNGQTASAWSTYRDAETAAMRKGQRERAEFAGGKAAALFNALSYVTIEAPPGVDGLVVTRDGKTVGAAALGTAVPIDPGAHTIEATAPGRTRFRQSVEVAARGARVLVHIPALAREATPVVAPPARTDAPTGTQRIVGIVLLSVGGAALATGGVFGVVAISRNDVARHQHCSAVDCEARGVELIHQARDAATVSTIAFAAGLGVAAAGLGLVLTAPSTQTRIAVSPAGVLVGGTF
jgi:hypothetical protein